MLYAYSVRFWCRTLDVSPTCSYSNWFGRASNEGLPYLFQASNRNCMSNSFCSFQYVSGFKKRFCPLINALAPGWYLLYIILNILSTPISDLFSEYKTEQFTICHTIAPCFPLSFRNNSKCVASLTEFASAKIWTFVCHIL